MISPIGRHSSNQTRSNNVGHRGCRWVVEFSSATETIESLVQRRVVISRQRPDRPSLDLEAGEGGKASERGEYGKP